MLGRGEPGAKRSGWEHSVPKVAQADPRISFAYRHSLDPAVYANKRTGARA
jgi:hypothetical protein